jgi:hypothetical protein
MVAIYKIEYKRGEQMGTPFTDIYGYVLTIIEDYELNNVANIDEEEFYNFLKGFVITGIPEFDSYTSLSYTAEEETQDDDEEVIRYYFVEVLSSTEIKILGKIATAQYFKKKVQNVLAYEQFMSQREFKKESASMGFKEKHRWYNDLVSDYMADIRNYRFDDDQIENLPFFGEYL